MRRTEFEMPMLRGVLVGIAALLLAAEVRAGQLVSLGAGTQVGGISGDGKVIVGSVATATPGQPVAFRWTQADGLVPLGLSPTPGDFPYSQATAVNTDGSVIVGTASVGTGVSQAFRWTQGTGIVPLGSLPGENLSAAYGVSGDGNVVVGSTGAAYSFRWTQAEGMKALDSTPGNFDRAYGASQDGSVVVGQDSGIPTNHGFRWTAGTGSVLIDPPGQVPPSIAMAVTPDGAVMTGYNYALTGNSAYRWTQGGGFVSLDPAGDAGTLTNPNALSADGSTIVGFWNPAGTQKAFIWDTINGLRSLDEALAAAGVDLTGWTLVEATGISGDGSIIVGNGIHNGSPEAFFASLTPEPGMLSILAAGGFLLMRRSGRRFWE